MRVTTRRHLLASAAFTLQLLAVHSASAQRVPSLLGVTGDVRMPLSVKPDELKAMPRTRVQVKDEDERSVTYEGVLVAELLERAGATLGTELRGNALTTYVVASATDGYQVVFSLAELDPAIAANEIIVADTIDGRPLSTYQGPLRIVAPRDGRPARSIRMLERLEVVRLKK
jgi:hypothetical protein